MGIFRFKFLLLMSRNSCLQSAFMTAGKVSYDVPVDGILNGAIGTGGVTGQKYRVLNKPCDGSRLHTTPHPCPIWKSMDRNAGCGWQVLETQSSFQHSGPHELSSSLSDLISSCVSMSRTAELFLTSAATEGLHATPHAYVRFGWPFDV